jgi:hypothetical protein
LRDSAANIFNIAYEIVARPEILRHLVESEENKLVDQLLLDTRLLLMHLILSHTMKAQMDNGKVIEAMETHRRMSRLEKMIEEMGIWSTEEECVGQKGLSAPAA